MFRSACGFFGIAIGIDSTVKHICERIPHEGLGVDPYGQVTIRNIGEILKFFPKLLEAALACNGYSYAEYQQLNVENKKRFKDAISKHLYKNKKIDVIINKKQYYLHILNDDDFKKSLIEAVGDFLIKDAADSIIKNIFDLCNEKYHHDSSSSYCLSTYKLSEYFSNALHSVMNKNNFSYIDYLKWNEVEKETFQRMIAEYFVEEYKDKAIALRSHNGFSSWDFCPETIHTSFKNPEPLLELELEMPVRKNRLWNNKARLFAMACQPTLSQDVLGVIYKCLKDVMLPDSESHRKLLRDKRREGYQRRF